MKMNMVHAGIVLMGIFPGCLAQRSALVDVQNAWRRTRVFFTIEADPDFEPGPGNPLVFVTVPREPTVLDRAIRPVLASASG